MSQIQILLLSCIFINKCLGSALHGPCESNEHCGTVDTFCRNGTCACIDNFLVMHDTCLQVHTPHIHCKRKEKCHQHMGIRSICKESKCVCKPFHHIHKGQCVKNRDLFDSCEVDHQCYCGQQYVDGMACIKNVCTCKVGFKPQPLGRKCIPYERVTLVEEPQPQASQNLAFNSTAVDDDPITHSGGLGTTFHLLFNVNLILTASLLYFY